MESDKQLVEFKLDDGSSVVFETDALSDGPQRVGRGSNKPDIADEKFEAVASRIRPAAQVILNALKELNTPSEIGLEFGLKFSAKTGVIVASADSEVNFKVSIKWKSPS